eukprot:2338093-Amphidinium_carterae.1
MANKDAYQAEKAMPPNALANLRLIHPTTSHSNERIQVKPTWHVSGQLKPQRSPFGHYGGDTRQSRGNGIIIFALEQFDLLCSYFLHSELATLCVCVVILALTSSVAQLLITFSSEMASCMLRCSTLAADAAAAADACGQAHFETQ